MPFGSDQDRINRLSERAQRATNPVSRERAQHKLDQLDESRKKVERLEAKKAIELAVREAAKQQRLSEREHSEQAE